MQRFAQHSLHVLDARLARFLHVRIFVLQHFGEERNRFGQQRQKVIAQFLCDFHTGSEGKQSHLGVRIPCLKQNLVVELLPGGVVVDSHRKLSKTSRNLLLDIGLIEDELILELVDEWREEEFEAMVIDETLAVVQTHEIDGSNDGAHQLAAIVVAEFELTAWCGFRAFDE